MGLYDEAKRARDGYLAQASRFELDTMQYRAMAASALSEDARASYLKAVDSCQAQIVQVIELSRKMEAAMATARPQHQPQTPTIEPTERQTRLNIQNALETARKRRRNRNRGRGEDGREA